MEKETKCYCGHTTYCDCGTETLEEAARSNYKRLYEGEPLTQEVPIDAFINGAKWQQEQDKNKYSEEDVKEAFDAGESFGSLPFNSMTTSNRLNKKEWFEQFKNK